MDFIYMWNFNMQSKCIFVNLFDICIVFLFIIYGRIKKLFLMNLSLLEKIYILSSSYVWEFFIGLFDGCVL